jgi:hypothetical protein
VIAQIDSLIDLFATFPDEQSCLDHLRQIRWRDGEFCSYCGGNRVYHFSDRKSFKCGSCRKRFSIKVGTIFEDTKLPLRKWFMAIWLVTNRRKGIASTTLAKDLKITQKTAWFVLRRLRHAAQTHSFNAPLKSDVETDTMLEKHADKRVPGPRGGANKAVVHGMVQRDGEPPAKRVPGHKPKTLQSKVRSNIAAGSAALTDEDRAFIDPNDAYTHLSVNRSEGEYVCLGGFVHTNEIESVWALLKRQIVSIHHWVSRKNLRRYVDEMTWWFNRRDMSAGPRMKDNFGCVEGRLI